jgi:dimethylamine monooxygenase subunit A
MSLSQTSASLRPRRHHAPFEKGVYEVAPLLRPLGASDAVFEIDEDFSRFREEKLRSLLKHPERHVCEHRLLPEQRARAVRFFVERLLLDEAKLFEWDPKLRVLHATVTGETLSFDETWKLRDFSTRTSIKTTDALVALALQVPEDFSIWTCDKDDDWMAYASVCLPNHWAPEEKIGRNFFAVHEPVAESGPMLRSSKQLVQGMIGRGPFVRFAWGVATDTRLNHHPQEPVGRRFDPERPELYVRVERQTLHGFPEENFSFFTIRTSFENVSELAKSPELSAALKGALKSMTPASLVYKGLAESLDSILNWLDDLSP